MMAEASDTVKWPKTISTTITKYSQESTIHGVKYIASRSKPLAHQIFWTVVFTISTICFGYFVFNIFNRCLDNSMMIIDDSTETNIFHIPFPAVTICPIIKSDLGHSFTKEYGKKYLMAKQICHEPLMNRHLFNMKSFFQLVTKQNNSLFPMDILFPDWMDTLMGISSQHKDVFAVCQFATFPNSTLLHLLLPLYKTCKRLFHPILTNDGLCYTFNTIDDVLRNESLHTEFKYHQINISRGGCDPENGYSEPETYPYKAIVKGAPGSTNGLKMILTTSKLNKTALCYPTTLGFTLILHSPSEYPNTYNKYISLGYDTRYRIAVEPKTIRTSKELRSVPPETRNCYFNDERHLKFFRFYNQQNCRLECYANYTAATVGCVSFSSPRDANTSTCAFYYKDYGWDQPNYYKFVSDHSKTWGIPNSDVRQLLSSDCNCLPECNSIQYDYAIDKRSDGTPVGAGLISAKPTSGSATKYQTTVEIVFEKPSFIGEQRVFVYTFDTLISDFGGLLGLFMGGSLLSVIELFYFLTLQNCFKSA